MKKIKAERFATVRKPGEDLKKENFGGIYFIDKGEKSHLNVLTGKADAFARFVSDDAILHPVKYSWVQLNKAQYAATSLFGKQGIHSCDVSLEGNHAVIGVMDDLIIDGNPIQSPILKLTNQQKKAREPLSVTEMQRICNEIPFLQRKEDRRFLAVQVSVALRPCEVLGLQWRDIDLENNLHHIRRTALPPDWFKPEVKEAKTNGS